MQSMSFFSRKKQHSSESSNSAPATIWSAYYPLRGSPSPFRRHSHALSTTATAAGKLFLFGGCIDDKSNGDKSNDLYVFSTRDFSTTLLQTKGETPPPRFGYGAASSTHFLIWGGWTFGKAYDKSLYLLNLVSRKWTCVEINGRGPCSRDGHTVNLVGSNLFVFGGRVNVNGEGFSDMWALDLNCLNSDLFWESYEAARGGKPPRRWGHVSVTTGDRIIVFGGGDHSNRYNDTWSFDTSTRKWTELQCTGSIPSPRVGHAAALVDDIMYVFGGRAVDGSILGDLTTLNLSTQRWTSFQDIEPSPSARENHAMASDGTRVFVLGGVSSGGVPADGTKPIHVLNTKQLDYSKPFSNGVNPGEKTTQLARKSSADPLSQGQPQEPTSSSSDAHAAHRAPSFQRATPEESDHPASLRITHERLVEFERKLSAMLAAQTERDRRIAQLTALLKQSEANAQRELAEVRAELEARKSELAALHLRLKDAESGWAKSKAEAGTSGAKTAANLVNTDEDRVVRMLMERVRALESKMASPRVWNEKSIEAMECTNED